MIQESTQQFLEQSHPLNDQLISLILKEQTFKKKKQLFLELKLPQMLKFQESATNLQDLNQIKQSIIFVSSYLDELEDQYQDSLKEFEDLQETKEIFEMLINKNNIQIEFIQDFYEQKIQNSQVCLQEFIQNLQQLNNQNTVFKNYKNIEKLQLQITQEGYLLEILQKIQQQKQEQFNKIIVQIEKTQNCHYTDIHSTTDSVKIQQIQLIIERYFSQIDELLDIIQEKQEEFLQIDLNFQQLLQEEVIIIYKVPQEQKYSNIFNQLVNKDIELLDQWQFTKALNYSNNEDRETFYSDHMKYLQNTFLNEIYWNIQTYKGKYLKFLTNLQNNSWRSQEQLLPDNQSFQLFGIQFHFQIKNQISDSKYEIEFFRLNEQKFEDKSIIQSYLANKAKSNDGRSSMNIFSEMKSMYGILSPHLKECNYDYIILKRIDKRNFHLYISNQIENDQLQLNQNIVIQIIDSLGNSENEYNMIEKIFNLQINETENLIDHLYLNQMKFPIEEYQPKITEKHSKLIEQYRLDEYQTQILFEVLDQSNRITLIEGPAGTGKTYLMLTIAQIFLEIENNLKKTQNNKILICTHNNLILNDTVQRLVSEFYRQRKPDPINQHYIIRIGRINTTEQRSTLKFFVEYQQQLIFFNKIMKQKQNDQICNKIKLYLASQIRFDQGFEYFTPQDLRRDLESLTFMENYRYSTDIEIFQNLLIQTQVLLDQNWQLLTDIQNKILQESVIIITTNSSSISLHQQIGNIQDINFVLTIIDEAPQCSEVSTLYPLRFQSKKILLVGDPLQMPFEIYSPIDSKKYNYCYSLFERIQFQKGQLQKPFPIQYRMNPTIFSLINFSFYENKISIPTSQFSQSNLCFFNISFSHVRNTYSQDQQSYENWFYNPEQADEVIKFLLNIFQDNRNQFKNISVLSPHNGQLAYLKMLMAKLTELPLSRYQNLQDSINFSNIRTFQGKQSDTVIVSLADAREYDQNWYRNQNYENEIITARKMNVLLSRARERLFIFGQLDYLKHLNDLGKNEYIYSSKIYQFFSKNPELIQNIEQPQDSEGKYRKILSKFESQIKEQIKEQPKAKFDFTMKQDKIFDPTKGK